MLENQDMTLEIQRELVDQGKPYDRTKAASHLLRDLEQNLMDNEAALADLQRKMQDAETRTAHGEKQGLRELKAKYEAQKRVEEEKRRLLASQSAESLDSETIREARKGKWKSRLNTFVSLLGVSISIVTNLILPLVGVTIAP